MITRSFLALTLGALAFSVDVSAQSAQCAAQALPLRDACQKGTDIFTMLAPQVNGALTGGGPVLGSSRAVRGLSIGIRVNAVDGRVPDLGNVQLSSTGIVRSTMRATWPSTPACIRAPKASAALWAMFSTAWISASRSPRNSGIEMS